MPVSVSLIRKLEQVEPGLREVLLALLEEIDRQREETVTKKEFNELKEIVRELAEAQKRTEERVEELAQAQTRTEQRLDSLANKVEELAEAQKRTEQRIEELAEAQKRTEERLEKLAAAQERTEKELQKLVGEHAKTREHVGGLLATVGYILENEAMRALPGLLLEEFGLRVKDRLVRKFLVDVSGNPMEVNIVGEAMADGKEFLVVGESNSQLSKGKVKEFLDKKLKRLAKPFGLEFFPILVTHMITAPDVADYALERGIRRIYYSYEFSR